MITEREHWLSITDDPDWRRNYISDPNISLHDTVDAIVAAFSKRPKPKRILEIGCGYGRLTREIRQRFPKADVLGFDINPAVLNAAREYDPGTVFCDDMQGIAELDAVYSVAVFQHIPDAEKCAYIGQAFESLNPGGVLRVQFIEGDRDNFLDHWTSADLMVSWARDAGFASTRVTSGLVHHQWSWLTAMKGTP